VIVAKREILTGAGAIALAGAAAALVAIRNMGLMRDYTAGVAAKRAAPAGEPDMVALDAVWTCLPALRAAGDSAWAQDGIRQPTRRNLQRARRTGAASGANRSPSRHHHALRVWSNSSVFCAKARARSVLTGSEQRSRSMFCRIFFAEPGATSVGKCFGARGDYLTGRPKRGLAGFAGGNRNRKVR
jgi:hypothetical protein